MESTEFIFDGRNSDEFGLKIVKIQSGFYPSPFIGGQEIREEVAPMRRQPHFHGTQKQVLEFEVTFSLGDEKFTPQKNAELARWLCKNEYKPFQTTDFVGKVFYVILVNQADLQTVGLQQGYFTARFRCNAGYAFTLPRMDIFELEDNSNYENPERITITNESNVYDYHYPITEIQKIGLGDIKLVNRSDGGRESVLENLEDEEVVYIDHYNKTIISDKGNYRLNNFNKKWMRLTYGVNQVDVHGACLLKVKNQFPVYL